MYASSMQMVGKLIEHLMVVAVEHKDPIAILTDHVLVETKANLLSISIVTLRTSKKTKQR